MGTAAKCLSMGALLDASSLPEDVSNKGAPAPIVGGDIAPSNREKPWEAIRRTIGSPLIASVGSGTAASGTEQEYRRAAQRVREQSYTDRAEADGVPGKDDPFSP